MLEKAESEDFLNMLGYGSCLKLWF
jgi:hypothetical protein